MIKQLMPLFAIISLALSAFTPTPAPAGEVKLAVAANFAAPMKALQKRFESATSHTLLISLGSSGKFYTQLKHGAPFDVFLSADAERPRKLEEEKETVAGSRFTYAVGQLVLWSPQPGLVDEKGDVLKTDSFKKLAIADPKTAPYGAAAREVLQKLGLWEKLSPRLVQGVDIGQACQFVASGNAELGFVALSQVQGAGGKIQGSAWRAPDTLHEPIRQQAVLLNAGRENKAARDFLEFLKSGEAREIIRAHGYKDEKEKENHGQDARAARTRTD